METFYDLYLEAKKKDSYVADLELELVGEVCKHYYNVTCGCKCKAEFVKQLVEACIKFPTKSIRSVVVMGVMYFQMGVPMENVCDQLTICFTSKEGC